MFYVLIFVSTLSRFIPHPANFVPIGAATVFIGNKKGVAAAAAFVILTMFISDIFLGFGSYTPFVYLGFLAYPLASILSKKGPIGFIGAPLVGSVSFFLVSNFGVWVSGWYPQTLPGFLDCYIKAIPFYRNTLLSDILFCALIFSIYTIYKKITEGGMTWQRVLQKLTLIKK
ncbi:MAG: hypothetical protein OEV37_03215 [Candidatus Berkelbacteria bacterium]|nr:hypothetical protein [Candidatus Berkelbacteria bacterium]